MKSFNENFNIRAWLIDAALTLSNKRVRNLEVKFTFSRRSQTNTLAQWVMAVFLLVLGYDAVNVYLRMYIPVFRSGKILPRPII